MGGIIGIHYASGDGFSSSSSSSSYSYSGGLVGRMMYEGGRISNSYFVDSDGTNGVGDGSCTSSQCIRRTKVQIAALTSVSDWLASSWGYGGRTHLPAVKYAETVARCSDDTYTTKTTCKDANTSWMFEGAECGGDSGVVCGALLPGQPISWYH